MCPLGTNDSDELTHFLCFPEAPARWGISCVHLYLEISPTRTDKPWAEGRRTGASALLTSLAMFTRKERFIEHGETGWRNRELKAGMIMGTGPMPERPREAMLNRPCLPEDFP